MPVCIPLRGVCINTDGLWWSHGVSLHSSSHRQHSIWCFGKRQLGHKRRILLDMNRTSEWLKARGMCLVELFGWWTLHLIIYIYRDICDPHMHGWNPSCPSDFVLRKGKCVRKNTWNPGVMGWSLLGLGLFLLLFTGFSDTSFSAECDHHQPRLGQVTLYLSLVGNGLNLQPPQKPAKLSHFDSLGGGSSLKFGSFFIVDNRPLGSPIFFPCSSVAL